MNEQVETENGDAEQTRKYLGRNAYGTIPHLPGSRIGTGEHHVDEGQNQICTQKIRDPRDRVIVTEKLDGANVAVANADGNILALGRAGYSTESSPYEHIRMFGDWVGVNEKRFSQLLKPGESLHGEWMALAHGTRYELLHEPFVVFDIKDRRGKRLTWDEIFKRSLDGGFITPRMISDGPPVSVDEVLPDIEWSGHGYLSMDKVEGAVWRVEHENKFDFMAKWVRPNKEDGKYLPENSGQPAIWHWRPEYERRNPEDQDLVVSRAIHKAVRRQKPVMNLNHELSKIPGFRKSPIRALGELVREPSSITSVGERTRIGGVLKGLGDFLIEESIESALRDQVTFDHGVLFKGKTMELPFNPTVRPAVKPQVKRE